MDRDNDSPSPKWKRNKIEGVLSKEETRKGRDVFVENYDMKRYVTSEMSKTPKSTSQAFPELTWLRDGVGKA